MLAKGDCHPPPDQKHPPRNLVLSDCSRGVGPQWILLLVYKSFPERYVLSKKSCKKQKLKGALLINALKNRILASVFEVPLIHESPPSMRMADVKREKAEQCQSFLDLPTQHHCIGSRKRNQRSWSESFRIKAAFNPPPT